MTRRPSFLIAGLLSAVLGSTGTAQQTTNEEFARRQYESGLAFLSRRGPDSSQRRATTDGRVEFLHARLAIVDRSAGAHQPLVDPESGVMVAFVGEIYNYEELRRELADYPFRTKSDTEVLLAGYVRHGIRWFERLRGMFAVAIADERRHRLFLVRDPVGKKPLFAARWKDGIYFGTTVLAMACGTAEPVRLDAGPLDAEPLPDADHAHIDRRGHVVREVVDEHRLRRRDDCLHSSRRRRGAPDAR